MPIDEAPVDHREVAAFGEADNDAASIRYSVPLPGSYTFDRIVPLDMVADWFTPEASEAGSSLVDLGIVAMEGGRVASVNAERLAAYVRSSLPAAARPSMQLAAEVGAGSWRDTSEPSQPSQPSDPRVPRYRTRAAGRLETESLAAQQLRRDDFIEKQAVHQAKQAKERVLTAISYPVAGLGNSIQMVPVTAQGPLPRIALVETYQLSASFGDYGLGRTLQTFSLLPGERTTITLETWRTYEATHEDASSIFDSSDTSAQTRFTSALTKESGSAFQDQGGWAFSVGVKAGGGLNLGVVSANASVETGFSANHQEARQTFAKEVSQSAGEHASQCNSARRQSVQSVSSSTEAGGTSETTVRELANTNLRRVLNFVFRELNQTYRVTTSLRSIKVAFYNGNSDSAEVVPLAELPRLVRKHVGAAQQEKVVRGILALLAQAVDHEGTPRTMLEVGTRNGGVFTWTDATLDDKGALRFDDNPLSSAYSWRNKRGPVGQSTAPEKDKVDGVVASRTEVVLRTDNIVVEALLGRADALDPYASALQALDLRSREADIARKTLESKRIEAALALVAAQDDHDKVAAWDTILGEKPDIQLVPLAAVDLDVAPVP